MAYRDTFKLVLFFAESEFHLRPEKMTLDDFNTNFITAFLQWLEQERGCSVATRNQRLAALRAFARYARTQHPAYLFESQKIEYETKQGLKRAEFYHDGFRKNVPSKLDMDTMPDYRYPIRPKEVIARFMTGYCELCCKNELPVMIYQVKSLKSLAGNETWEQFMLKKRRKTLIVCEDCYKTITNS